MKRNFLLSPSLRLFAVLLLLFSGFHQELLAQGRRSNYTIVQAGGMFGLQASRGEPLHGYQFQFVFGKNFEDRTFAGFGIGNDVYRGHTTISNGNKTVSQINTLPIFMDFRQVITPVSIISNLGFMANAGFAPGLGGNYYRGFVGKAGLTYSHLLIESSDLQFSLGYGFQQFDSRFVQTGFHQHQLFLTVGLFVY